VRVDFSVNGTPFSLLGLVDSRFSYLRKWHVVGPFDFIRDVNIAEQKYGPETEKIDLSKIYKGAGGQGVNWRKARCGEDNIVDLNKHFHIPLDSKVAYAVTYLDTKNPQNVSFWISSDDGAEAWLNGNKIYSSGAPRAITEGPDEVKADLIQGRNVLLLKISQHNFDWLFKVAVDALHPLEDSYGKK